MTTGFIPERIDGPRPLRPLYGLLQAAEAPGVGVAIIDDPSPYPRWAGAAQLWPYPPSVGQVTDPCADTSPPTVKEDGDEGYEDFENPTFSGMTLTLAETCKTYRVPDQAEFKARAVAAFGAVESGMIAREFMAGDAFPDMPHLADGNGTFPNGSTATDPAYALALLEGEISASRRLGLIHCSPLMATILQERFQLDRRDGVIRTINGTVVVADAGYRGGATPDGRSAGSDGQEWMFATGPIDLRRAPVFTTPDTVSEALDRGTGATNGRPNTLTYRVERYVLAVWDTIVQAAVLADPCKTTPC